VVNNETRELVWEAFFCEQELKSADPAAMPAPAVIDLNIKFLLLNLLEFIFKPYNQ
jgi:hypothetical protein